MRSRIRAALAAMVIAGCSSANPADEPIRGRIVVALTVDWEGAYLSAEGLDAMDELRGDLGDAPITHFVSAGYFTKERPDPTVGPLLLQAVRKGDELALHLHAWKSLAKASGVEPKLSPSFLSGTDTLLEFEDGDVGFELDLDAYSVAEVRALLRTSRRLLEQTHVVSRSFRAGGYLGTPKVLQAIRDEGYTVDSSATDYRQLEELEVEVLPQRLQALWPNVDPMTQPYLHPPATALLQMPIAGFADYVTAAELVSFFDKAHAALQKAPDRDVFVVLGFHQETAANFGGRLREAMKKVRERPEIAESLMFATVEHAAELARTALPVSR